ncbi:MAG: PAS domain-containing protein [Desulfamplus sp.]|nr:PAS domain-containing protein [Desulfamplus sp.]
MKNITEISKPTILYVDDDMANLTSFKAVFRRTYEIFIASSAQEAIDILRSNKILVMITDQRMPGMTGSELLEIVAKDFPHTLRFMLTGFTDYHPLVDAINKGRLHGYFPKPFDAEQIRSRIEQNLKNYYLELENHQLLKKLQESEQFLDTIIEHIPHTICVKDAENLAFVRVNVAGEEQFGYSREEIIGRTSYDLFTQEEAEILTKEDKEVLASGKPIDIPEKKIYIHNKGDRWFHTQKMPIMDENGSPNFLLIVCRDITERKLMLEKEEVLEKQILQLNKTQALGRLASGVAHDFNNMLSPIISYTGMLQMDIPEGSDLRLYVDGIYTAALRSKELVHQILTFSRKAELKAVPIKLKPIIKEVLQLIRSSLPCNIKIVEKIDDCGFVIADATQIHQIVMNLAANSCHAMEPDGGVLTVELKHEAPETSLQEDLSDECVCIKIKDTGSGIDQSIIDKVFDPYFTTKSSDKGTGLGLSVVQGIVKSYHGDINIKSELGKGTEVTIYLPIHCL